MSFLNTYSVTLCLGLNKRPQSAVPIDVQPSFVETNASYLSERSKMKWLNVPVLFHEAEYYAWLAKLLMKYREYFNHLPLVLTSSKRDNCPLAASLLGCDVLLSVNGSFESQRLKKAEQSHVVIEPKFRHHPSDDLENELTITLVGVSNFEESFNALILHLEQSMNLIRKGTNHE